MLYACNLDTPTRRLIFTHPSAFFGTPTSVESLSYYTVDQQIRLKADAATDVKVWSLESCESRVTALVETNGSNSAYRSLTIASLIPIAVLQPKENSTASRL